MIPSGLSREQFSAAYRRQLDSHAPNMIAELGLLLQRVVPSTVTDASVEIFVGEDGREAPSIWIYWSGPNKKVDSSDSAIFPGRSEEIRSGLQRKPLFDDSYFSDHGFDCVAVVADSIKNWFAECWWKAGGWMYAVPATVCVHDGFGDGRPGVLAPARAPSNGPL